MGRTSAPLPLRLYLRSGCSLCEAMVLELHQLQLPDSVTIEYLDVDTFPEWQQAFGDKVPLLLTPDGQELSRYFLDPDVVIPYLASGQ